MQPRPIDALKSVCWHTGTLWGAVHCAQERRCQLLLLLGNLQQQQSNTERDAGPDPAQTWQKDFDISMYFMQAACQCCG
jgi:hypothetical protein